LVVAVEVVLKVLDLQELQVVEHQHHLLVLELVAQAQELLPALEDPELQAEYF
jgi:hypothetical protein